MKNIKLYLIYLSAILLIAGSVTSLPAQQDSLAGFIPHGDVIVDWTPEYAPENYTPNDLFQYIDGEAELYRDYGFLKLVTVPYIHRKNADLYFSLDIYDMGTPLNAFGIYSSHRRPENDFANIGTEAVVSTTAVRFYQNRYYVRIQAGAVDDRITRIINQVATEVSKSLPDGKAPEELQLLPSAHRKPHSVKYLKKGFMGLEQFRSVLQAEYLFPEDSCTGFIGWFPGDQEAAAALSHWEANLAERGTVSQSLDGDNKTILQAETPYQGKIIARQQGRFIVGVTDYNNPEIAMQLLGMLQKQLVLSE